MKLSRSRLDFLLLALVFACSRFIYIAFLGVSFDARSLTYYLQYLDPKLLRTDLLHSVYYMHFQPPAFNLFLGAVLKLFPDNEARAFQIAFLLMGFALLLTLFKLLLAVGVTRPIALTLAIAYSLLPTTVIYENWLFYTYPLALVLIASALFLVHFLRSSKPLYGLLFFFSLVLISFIHAMFGAAWIIVILAALLILNKSRRPLILRCAIVPLALVALLALKQYAVFGTFTTGNAYLGPNLACRVGAWIPLKDQQPLIDSGQVPRFFFEKSTRPFSKFSADLPAVRPTGIEALDQDVKSTGAPNFNNIGFLAVGDAYLRGTFTAMKKYPLAYPRSFLPTFVYFSPAGDDPFARQVGSESLNILANLQNCLLCGQIDGAGPGWFLVAALPLLVLFAVRKLYKAYKSKSFDDRAAALAFMLFNILYSSLVTVTFTWGDWNRYRFAIDPFFVVLAGLCLTSLHEKRGGSRSSGATHEIEAKGFTDPTKS